MVTRWPLSPDRTKTFGRFWQVVYFCLLGAAFTSRMSHAAPPTVIYPEADLVALYNEAWQEAKARILDAPKGAPVKRYMDENVYDDQIWIWDSCFMAQFTKYAAADYPGIETLEALYAPVVEGKPSPLRIHIYDNPPLFAWCELLYWRFHGNRARLEDILLKRNLLQKHFEWFANPPTGTRPASSPNRIELQAVTAGNGAKGFLWRGAQSGMDNTPRGRGCGGYRGILWIDAISQQALNARCIAELYRALGHEQEAQTWQARFDALAKEINTFYWDERDGFYYDIAFKDGQPCRVKTIASFWPLLAGVVPPDRAERMIACFAKDQEFFGKFPFPTVARSDPDYDAATGNYWRGGIWLPTAYMTLQGLERTGARRLADRAAMRLLRQMSETYKTVSPATIWECYAPEANLPSTEHGRRVRSGFCGWSALGPVNLFLENILGFRSFDAVTHTITWQPPEPEDVDHKIQFPMGIEHLTFGDTTVSLWSNDSTLRVETSRPITLIYRNRTFPFAPGKHVVSCGQ